MSQYNRVTYLNEDGVAMYYRELISSDKPKNEFLAMAEANLDMGLEESGDTMIKSTAFSDDPIINAAINRALRMHSYVTHIEDNISIEASSIIDTNEIITIRVDDPLVRKIKLDVDGENSTGVEFDVPKPYNVSHLLIIASGESVDQIAPNIHNIAENPHSKLAEKILLNEFVDHLNSAREISGLDHIKSGVKLGIQEVEVFEESDNLGSKLVNGVYKITLNGEVV